MLVEAAAANPAEIDRELDRGNAVPKTLPFKDQAIRAAAYGGSGRETEYRIKGNSELVFVVQQPDKHGVSTKSWRAYYSRVEDERQIKRKLRLGKYPAVSLAQARRRAAEVAEAVETGRDPVAEEHAQRAQRERNGLTLADLIAEYIEDQRRSGVATVREIERALNRDIVTTLGHFCPADITDLQIEDVIDGVAERGNAMARHLLVYLRGVYNHRPPVDDRYLSDVEIAQFWRALDRSGADPRTVLALKLLLLTGARPGEVVRADISELHLTGREPTWLLPAQRTKNGLPHLVPLTPFCATLFAAALGNRKTGPVFPSDATEGWHPRRIYAAASCGAIV